VRESKRLLIKLAISAVLLVGQLFAVSAFALAQTAGEPLGSVRARELPTAEQFENEYNRNDISDSNSISPLTLNSDAPGVALREPVITLQGAVQSASASNRTVNSAREEVSRFTWDYRAAQTSRLPNIRAISYLAQQTVGGNPVVPKQANAFVFVSALMPITQQYRLGMEASVVKLGREIAQYKLDKEIDDTRARVKTAYYKMVLDRSLLATIDVSIKYLNELETVVANRVKEGSSLKLDAMKVSARLEKTKLDQFKARNTLQIDREKFNHLLGRNLQDGIALEAVSPPDETEINLREMEQKALAQRPEIRGAAARLRQVKLEKKIRLAEYIPNVSVGAVYIGLPGFNNDILPRSIFAPGIFINYNAFDWGRRAFLAKAQAKSEKAAALNLASIQDDVLIDLHAQANKLAEARLATRTTKYERTVALEDLRVSFNRYKFTSEKLADVLASVNGLAEANNNYHHALIAFWEAKAEFERAVGQQVRN